MNWTGGKLKSYVKRNGKVTDSQKKHFAKVPIGYRAAAQATGPDASGPTTQILRQNRYERCEPQPKRNVVKLAKYSGSQAPPTGFEQTQMPGRQSSSSSFEKFTVRSTVSAQQLTAKDISLSALEAQTKLLRKSDWLGLSMLRPFYFDFPSTEQKAQIGRQRMSRRKKDLPVDVQIFSTRSKLGKRKRSLERTSSSRSLFQNTQDIKSTELKLPTTSSRPPTSSQRSDTTNTDPNDIPDRESCIPLCDPERSTYHLEENECGDCETREVLMHLPSLEAITASGATSFDELQAPSQYLEQCPDTGSTINAYNNLRQMRNVW